MKLIYTGDFERLKDFGFESRTTYYYLYLDNGYSILEIDVYCDDNRITIRNDYNEGDEIEIPSVIYDLIQAGIVKKEDE